MSELVRTTRQVVPTIYAYTTPGYAPHDGWTKIGETNRGAVNRIDRDSGADRLLCAGEVRAHAGV